MATQVRKGAPGKTPEAVENKLILLANDLAEKQLRAGTASSQVMNHFLKLGSTTQMLEKEILVLQKDLMVAKTDSIKSNKKIEELYSDAMKAFGVYSGREVEEDD